MATHSRILVWRIPGTEEPVQSTGSQKSDTTEHLKLALALWLFKLLQTFFLVLIFVDICCHFS